MSETTRSIVVKQLMFDRSSILTAPSLPQRQVADHPYDAEVTGVCLPREFPRETVTRLTEG